MMAACPGLERIDVDAENVCRVVLARYYDRSAERGSVFASSEMKSSKQPSAG